MNFLLKISPKSNKNYAAYKILKFSKCSNFVGTQVKPILVQYLRAKYRKVLEKRSTRLIFKYVAAIEPIFNFSECRNFLEHMIPPNRGITLKSCFILFSRVFVSVWLLFFMLQLLYQEHNSVAVLKQIT